MSNEDRPALQGFKGVAKLFPLPDLVMFPHVVQGLHIFESRYRQMTADALADDRLLALVLLRPGWEATYEVRPATHSVACLGRISAEQRLEDGRYNLELRGLCRARILHEIESPKLYRSARVEVLHDFNMPGPQAERDLRTRLVHVAPILFPDHPAAAAAFRRLAEGTLHLGTVSDILSFGLPLELEIKQELLQMQDVENRFRLLLRHLEKMSPLQPTKETASPFPPKFSEN
jgi:Lon protease-like protein